MAVTLATHSASAVGAFGAPAELDAAAIRACSEGDPGALRRFVVRYQPLVFAFLSRSLGSGPHVEDLAQEVFLRAFRGLARFRADGAARVSTWLLTIATRVAIDARKRRRVVTDPLTDGGHVTDPARPRPSGIAASSAGGSNAPWPSCPATSGMPTSSRNSWPVDARAGGSPRRAAEHGEGEALSRARAPSRAARALLGGNVMRHDDHAYPAEQPSADFADRVVVAVLRERRGAAWRSALFSVTGISLASVGALMSSCSSSIGRRARTSERPRARSTRAGAPGSARRPRGEDRRFAPHARRAKRPDLAAKPALPRHRGGARLGTAALGGRSLRPARAACRCAAGIPCAPACETFRRLTPLRATSSARHRRAKGRIMLEGRESSVLVSLRELMSQEEDRVRSEEEERLRSERERVAREQADARARTAREQADARARTAREAELAEAARKRSEQDAAATAAAIARAEEIARASRMAEERRHEQELARLGADARVRRLETRLALLGRRAPPRGRGLHGTVLREAAPGLGGGAGGAGAQRPRDGCARDRALARTSPAPDCSHRSAGALHRRASGRRRPAPLARRAPPAGARRSPAAQAERRARPRGGAPVHLRSPRPSLRVLPLTADGRSHSDNSELPRTRP